MRHRIFAAAWLAALLPLSALHAQRTVLLGVAGGVSIPQGTFGNGANTGWHALGTVLLNTPTPPLKLRLDAAYNRFAFNDAAPGIALGNSGSQTVWSATANATYHFSMTESAVSPYLISGLGAYRFECSLTQDCEDTTRLGWNGGLGVRLLTRSFLEARYHRSARGNRSVQYFPVTFGVTF